MDDVVQIDVPRLQMREVLAGRWRCCFNCDNWRRSEDSCHKFNEQPPIDVLIVGCSEWFAAGIPF
jgi:hypothetical protein